jgi:cytochrome b561
MLNNSAEKYGSLSKAIHWLTALLIIVLLGVGIYMADLPKEDPSRLQIFNLHKSFGVLVLMLAALRIVWLRISPAPILPAVFTAKEKKVVSSVKGVLYLLMFLVPFAGYLMSSAAGKAVSFFGLFDLPALVAESKSIAGFAHEAHELLAYAIIAFVALHMAGAIKHRLKDRNGPSDILNRML